MQVVDSLGGALDDVLLFAEPPALDGTPGHGWLAALDELAAREISLKFRTGGVTADVFPTSRRLATCIEAALDRELPFKCTAGLHHAVRHRDESTGFEHHGFLNVLLATRACLDGGSPDDVAQRPRRDRRHQPGRTPRRRPRRGGADPPVVHVVRLVQRPRRPRGPRRAGAAAVSGFEVDHLPYGVYSVADGPRRVGVRFGDSVLDAGALTGRPELAAPTLNPFLALGPTAWQEVREQLTEQAPDAAGVPLDEVRLHLPFEVADYVDFYCSEQHATNVGRIFRPDGEALTPNWKHLPIGYHGRAGTIVVSGTDVRRPCGQRPESGGTPSYGPSRRLDIEAELGFVVGTPSSQGTPVPASAFADHVFGVTALNDWSARDIQAWEYVPLGPFLGKSFATSISPWVTPLAALEAARVDLPGQDPEPLDYLRVGRTRGLRHRLRDRAERRGRQPAAVRRDVLVAGPDAGPPDRQRRIAPHRRPVRQRHDQRRRARAAGLVPRAELGRPGAVRGRPDLPPGRRRRHPPSLGSGRRWAAGSPSAR